MSTKLNKFVKIGKLYVTSLAGVRVQTRHCCTQQQQEDFLRSPFPDLEIPNVNIVDYVMQDFGRWPDKVATLRLLNPEDEQPNFVCDVFHVFQTCDGHPRFRLPHLAHIEHSEPLSEFLPPNSVSSHSSSRDSRNHCSSYYSLL